MGIRFACHSCQYALHVKDFQAGRRGKCPECKAVFQIPNADAPTSIPVESAGAAPAANKAPAPTSRPSAEPQSAPARKVTAETPTPAATVPQAPAPGTTTPAAEPAPAPAAPVSTAWYLRIADGQQFGPVDEATFMGWLSEGRVTQDSYVWHDGWPEWSSAPLAFPAHFASSPPLSPPAPVAAPAVAAPPAPSVAAPASSAPAISTPAISTPAPSTPVPADSRVHSATAEGVSGLTPIQRARLDKRLKKKRNYQIMLVGLCIAAVLLVCALVVVVMMQSE